MNAARALSTRTAALIELGLELQKQYEPSRLLATFCRGAQDVMGGRIAAVCVVDEHGPLSRFAARGPTADQVARIMLYVSAAFEAVWKRSRESLYALPWSWLDAVHPNEKENWPRGHLCPRGRKRNTC